ncbi:Os12g0566050 [Oryza sativa Japonica Group]|uniref:Os12g0566050 protein n=1 Tax=Oryza sativa subsp. japonica TaxID=39947 RepID=A0A0P0YBJ8_ORYSJ|nr:hypothetical protein EE612_060326 [Oryza sativa]BAT17691.1 Os12g0566050 [Oryza sativa Japonica Group]
MSETQEKQIIMERWGLPQIELLLLSKLRSNTVIEVVQDGYHLMFHLKTEYNYFLVSNCQCTLMTVQLSYAPGDHGLGLKRRRGIPFGTLPYGM